MLRNGEGTWNPSTMPSSFCYNVETVEEGLVSLCYFCTQTDSHPFGNVGSMVSFGSKPFLRNSLLLLKPQLRDMKHRFLQVQYNKEGRT